jgi:hypothetical protein
MQHSKNLKRIASGLINDEVGENPVEKNVPTSEIGAAVAAVRDVRQLVKSLEQFMTMRSAVSTPSLSKR